MFISLTNRHPGAGLTPEARLKALRYLDIGGQVTASGVQVTRLSNGDYGITNFGEYVGTARNLPDALDILAANVSRRTYWQDVRYA